MELQAARLAIITPKLLVIFFRFPTARVFGVIMLYIKYQIFERLSIGLIAILDYQNSPGIDSDEAIERATEDLLDNVLLYQASTVRQHLPCSIAKLVLPLQKRPGRKDIAPTDAGPET
jgi:hypothetical protein